MADRRLIISGTRAILSPEDRETVADVLGPYVARADEIGVGDCQTGVDALVREMWPRARVFAADWRAYGPRAGPMRNGEMVAWASDAVLGILAAFPCPRSRGTWDCVRKARDAQVSTVIKRVGGWPRG